MKSAESLANAYSQGTIYDRNVAAYSGTSTQNLRYIAETGKMGSAFDIYADSPELAVRKGDIVVVPVKGRYHIESEKMSILERAAYEPFRSLENAFYEAKMKSRHHYMREQLGLSIPTAYKEGIFLEGEFPYDMVINFVDFAQPELPLEKQVFSAIPFFSYLLERGYDFPAIDKLIYDMHKREGAILAFGNNIFEKGDVLPGNGGVRVRNVTPEDIACIEPLDQYARDFLRNLR